MALETWNAGVRGGRCRDDADRLVSGATWAATRTASRRPRTWSVARRDGPIARTAARGVLDRDEVEPSTLGLTTWSGPVPGGEQLVRRADPAPRGRMPAGAVQGDSRWMGAGADTAQAISSSRSPDRAVGPDRRRWHGMRCDPFRSNNSNK